MSEPLQAPPSLEEMITSLLAQVPRYTSDPVNPDATLYATWPNSPSAWRSQPRSSRGQPSHGLPPDQLTAAVSSLMGST